MAVRVVGYFVPLLKKVAGTVVRLQWLNALKLTEILFFPYLQKRLKENPGFPLSPEQ